LERNQPAAAFLTAIEPQIVRSETGCEAGRVKELGVKARNFDEEVSAAIIPVEWEIAVQFQHAGDPVLY
jgi:hypothetical protein